jgi:glycosyltransferase involved in cell wall biosynthesis
MTTVVIPCFNGRRYLAEALLSALAQRDTAVIVVDDGSTDRSGDVAACYPGVRVIRQAHAGVAAARNAGLRAASGEFVLFLDADDRLTADAVARLRGALEREPRAALVYGRHSLIDGDGAPVAGTRPPRAKGTPFEALLRSNFIPVPGGVLHRRRVLVESGGFASGFDGAADYELYLRLSRRHPIASIEDVVVEYRRHDASMSAYPRAMLRTTLRAHRRHARGLSEPTLCAAARQGHRFWTEFYGDRVMEDARAAWRRGERRHALLGLATVAWHAPWLFLRHLGRASSVRLRGHRTLYKAKRLSP